jgi:hypothetical protein
MDARELTAHVREYYIPVLQDQIFLGHPLLTRLRAKNNIKVDGGRVIRIPYMLDKLVGGPYSAMDTFDTSIKKTSDYMEFNWKGKYVNITIDNWSLFLTEGTNNVISLLESKMKNAELTMNDLLTDDIVGTTIDTVNGFDGLWNGIDDGNTYSTYGAITRTAGFYKGYTGAYALNAYVDSNGGNISLDRLRIAMGKSTIGGRKPDLILTTQSIYNQIWSRVQPEQRFLGDSNNDLVNAGFSGINFDGTAILVDDHVPSGYIFGLTTEYIKFFIHKKRNFYFSDWLRPTNQDSRIAQLLVIGNLVVQSPRANFKFTGLNEY